MSSAEDVTLAPGRALRVGSLCMHKLSAWFIVCVSSDLKYSGQKCQCYKLLHAGPWPKEAVLHYSFELIMVTSTEVQETQNN